MNQSIAIFHKDLKAVSHAMATQDIRYYLNGVLIECNGAQTRLVATDGHRLHAVVQETTALLVEPVSFIIPADLVRMCLKAKLPRGSKDEAVIVLTFDQGKIEARLPDGTSVMGMAVDGKFPDYCRLIPRGKLELSPAVINPEYALDAFNGLRDFLDIKKSAFPPVGFAYRGSDAAILSCGGFTAVVMPYRADITDAADRRLADPMQAPEPVRMAA